MRLGLLGGFRLTTSEGALELPGTAQRLLALLGVRGGGPRSTVAGLLWPDVVESRAHASLRSTLWRLHRCAPDLVIVETAAVGLAPHVDVDVRVLTTRTRRLLEAREEESDLDQVAPQGELLPGWYDDWVLIERERVRQLHLHALEALAMRLCARGRHLDAIDVAYQVIGADPLRESAHRILIDVHLAENNVAEARRQFEVFRRTSLDELGVEPSATMRALVNRVRLPARRLTSTSLEVAPSGAWPRSLSRPAG